MSQESKPWPPNTPIELSIKGRSTEIFDDPAEELYIRFTRENWNDDEQSLDPINLPYRFTDQSVNRQRFSSALQVLFPNWPMLGVVALKSGKMPPVRKHPVLTQTYELKPVHCPSESEDNFAHSEIRCFRDNVFMEDNRNWSKPPKALGKEMRTDLFEEYVVYKKPDPVERF